MNSSTFSSLPFCYDMLQYFYDMRHHLTGNSLSIFSSRSFLRNETDPDYSSSYVAYYDAEAASYEEPEAAPVKRSGSWLDVVLPLVCMLGVVGNSLTLIILTRQKLLHGMDHLERSANYGLVGLALSDLLFCIAVLPTSLVGSDKTSSVTKWNQAFELYYKIYGVATINFFMMSSAWLIVATSVNRLVVVVYPLQARSKLDGKTSMIATVLTYALSLVLTLPHYVLSVVLKCQTVESDIMAEIRSRWPSETVTYNLMTYIRWVWPVLANFVPLIVLAACNTRLLLEMKKAAKHRRHLSCRARNVRQSSQKVTLTLLAIVVMFCILVCPAEILKYIDPYDAWGETGALLAAMANVMQAVNFACNFVPYCVVHPHFRKTVGAALLRCRGVRSEAGEDHESSQRRHLYSQNSSRDRVSESMLREHEHVELDASMLTV